MQKLKIVEFANSVDLEETAHYELPHLDLHCLPCYLSILNMIAGTKHFSNFADVNFCHSLCLHFKCYTDSLVHK